MFKTAKNKNDKDVYLKLCDIRNGGVGESLGVAVVAVSKDLKYQARVLEITQNGSVVLCKLPAGFPGFALDRDRYPRLTYSGLTMTERGDVNVSR